MYPLKNFFRFLFSLLSLPAISALLTDSAAYSFMAIPLCMALMLWADWGISVIMKAFLMRRGKYEKVEIASIILRSSPIPFRNGGAGYLAKLAVQDEQGQTYSSPLLFIHLSKHKLDVLRRHASFSAQEHPLDFLLKHPVMLYRHIQRKKCYYIVLDSLQALL